MTCLYFFFTCEILPACCLVQPANGCSARRSLVEKVLMLLSSLLISCFIVTLLTLLNVNAKKMISTRERHAEHPFAGQNTHHMQN